MSGFHTNIEKDTLENNYFRKVLFTGVHTQLVLMSLKPKEEIGMETHEDVDRAQYYQYFRNRATQDLYPLFPTKPSGRHNSRH